METISAPLAIGIVAGFIGILAVALHRRRKRLPPSLPGDVHSTTHASIAPLEVVCIHGPLHGQRFPFKRLFITIGRQPDNDIVLPGPLVSRHHAVIASDGNHIMLRDLDSTNGTWVNSRQIDEIYLTEQQQFQIGPGVFTLVKLGAAITPSPIPPPLKALAPVVPVSSTVIRSLQLQDYEAVKPIGEGGAASVHLYRTRDTGAPVAIKFLHNSADPYFKQKFHYEGRMGQQLRHPYVVQTLGIGEANGLNYIIMEYMPNGSLRDYLTPPRLNLDQIIQVIGQMCLALEYAHQCGVFHRDIKPENILFSQNLVAKLADFGIARFASVRTVTQEGMLVGTPDYMSFEQAKGVDIDGRSDQYSLGIVLYEMMTGTRPFQGAPLTIVGQHLSVKPRAPREINGTIPREIDRVVMKALEKDKNRRFPNMLKMAEAIGYRPDPAALAAVGANGTGKAAATGSARLVNIQTQQVLQLASTITMIGRANIPSPQISRQHARIRFEGGSYVLEDLNSSNGTYVNGQRISGPVRLAPGQYVFFGPAQFQFVQE